MWKYRSYFIWWQTAVPQNTAPRSLSSTYLLFMHALQCCLKILNTFTRSTRCLRQTNIKKSHAVFIKDIKFMNILHNETDPNFIVSISCLFQYNYTHWHKISPVLNSQYSVRRSTDFKTLAICNAQIQSLKTPKRFPMRYKHVMLKWL